MVIPERADRHGEHTVGEAKHAWAGVQHGAGDEPVVESVAQPCEVACVARGRCRGRLDLQRDDATARDLDDEVDLAATVLLTHVVARRPVRRKLERWSHLRDGKGVDESTEQVTVAHDRPHVEPQRRRRRGMGTLHASADDP